MGVRIRCIMFGLLCLITVRSVMARGIETTKLCVLLNTMETATESESAWTRTWALDGGWRRRGERVTLDIIVDSDYSRSDASKLDRLRTAYRFQSTHHGEETGRWYPMMLVQTEGNHSFSSIYTLAAYGMRRENSLGFLEATAGASKDLRTAEKWVGNVGFTLGYERKLGDRWKLHAGPKAEYGAFGDLRLAGDRLRYSLDGALDYQMTKKCGIGYRIWLGNTVPNSRRTQFFGLTYTAQ